MSRILVGLSGGVDSSVAAALLLEQGHEVVGGYMKNWINEENIAGHCPWEQDVEDAHAVANTLGIEFRVIDLIDQYRHRIVNYLLEGYRSGITPNPDVLCNREMKFGVFLDYALQQGFHGVGTGHYARRRHTAKPATPTSPVVKCSSPKSAKPAHRFNLPTAGKKDSQGICFIGNVKMTDFLSHYVPDSPGHIVDTQEKGHGIASPREGMAYVVVEKNQNENQLVVGWDEGNTPGLYASQAIVGSLSWVNEPIENGSIEAQPRYRAKSENVQIQPHGDPQNKKLKISFARNQRALTPGQICAFYDSGKLLGGGIFEQIIP
nr:tRNA-specific 2-thiouridylase MnmA-like [Nerophis lumbriciformis]